MGRGARGKSAAGAAAAPAARRRRRPWLAALLLTLPAAGYAAAASFTEYRFNRIAGSTPAEIVAQMRAHPVPTEAAGIAYASITDRYDIVLDTRPGGEANRCEVRRVSVDFRFVITLPEAAEEEAMSPGTRAMWREFVAFSKRHEEGHRAIFLECGRRFEAAAAKLRSDSGCQALRLDVLEMFREHYAACKARHAEYDEAESRRLPALSLFRAAR